MWVKNQNKDALVNANDICIYEMNKTTYQFRCYGYGNYYILGEYSTKEKAMKVMGMIQEQIKYCEERYENITPVLKGDHKPYWNKCEVVFQMPKDEEVE